MELTRIDRLLLRLVDTLNPTDEELDKLIDAVLAESYEEPPKYFADAFPDG